MLSEDLDGFAVKKPGEPSRGGAHAALGKPLEGVGGGKNWAVESKITGGMSWDKSRGVKDLTGVGLGVGQQDHASILGQKGERTGPSKDNHVQRWRGRRREPWPGGSR